VLSLTLAPLDGVEWPAEARFWSEGDFQLEGEGSESAQAAVTTLRFANPLDSAPPQLVAFVEEVQRLSDGSIEFEWLPNYGIEGAAGPYANAESTIVADLADSTVDIGWVGARALPGFEALLAPLLVDSQDLQERVFDAGIAERMLADLEEHGLAGITILPGPLRRIAGVEHTFATPADFAGQTIAGDHTELTQATMSALGATEIQGASGFPIDGADAILAHYAAIVGNGYHNQADSVVANLNMWPRPLAIVMSAASFAALTPQQQEALMTAGTAAVEPAMQAARQEDEIGGTDLCAGTIEVVEASSADLAAVTAALEPVYDDLEADPTTAAYLHEIRALKDELAAPPDTLVCPAE
jgi:TRAP-type C4-dicarboxylate transport system substrate-binding protein